MSAGTVSNDNNGITQTVMGGIVFPYDFYEDLTFFLKFEVEDTQSVIADGDIVYNWLTVPLGNTDEEHLTAACKVKAGSGAASAWTGTYLGQQDMSIDSQGDKTWFNQNSEDYISPEASTYDTTANYRRLRGDRSATRAKVSDVISQCENCGPRKRTLSQAKKLTK